MDLNHQHVVSEATLARRALILAKGGVFEPCLHCEVRRVSLCDAVPEPELDRLVASSVEATARAGQLLVIEGDPSQAFFNIVSGTAKLYKSLPDGRQQITGFAGPGYFLGLAVGGHYAFTAEAIDVVQYCLFSRSQFVQLLSNYPAAGQRLAASTANELIAAQEQMLLLGQKTARERLASFLLQWSSHLAVCGLPQDLFTLPMPREDIASYIGLTVETVSRNLTGLRKAQLIEVAGFKRIKILNRAKLKAISEGLS